MITAADVQVWNSAAWLAKAAAVAPSAPLWLTAGIARVLAQPNATSDGLLLLADALTEASDICAIERSSVDPRHLDRLADLCRRAAPSRAGCS